MSDKVSVPINRTSAAAFLKQARWGEARLEILAGDASFRRYDRVYKDGGQAVLMDAPPPHEDIRPFMAVCEYLADAGFSAPDILASDVVAGYMLLEDLGDDRYSGLLAENPGLEYRLYEAAIDTLVDLHGRTAPHELPYDGGRHNLSFYDEALLLREARLFTDWYLPALFGAQASAGEIRHFESLWYNLFSQIDRDDPVLVLRDYHADNLMWLPRRTGVAKVGLLDFQDAVIGHAAYDLVSLLQDARRDVPVDLEEQMITLYLKKSAHAGRSIDEDRFRWTYAVLGAQRNTKIIGIFMRLCQRDGKRNYLSLIPRVWGLLERDLEHPALADLKGWFKKFAGPDIRANIPSPAKLFRMPSKAMILAAGLGMRMRPLTERLPKPLLEVAGRTMLDRALDHLGQAGVEQVVVNVHYLPTLMRDHLKHREGLLQIVISDETDRLMNSGGGVAKALPLLGPDPFLVLNSDMIWQDRLFNSLSRLAGFWNPDKMDMLMLLIPTDKARGYDGKGDFHMDGDGRLTRRGTAPKSDYMFGGIQILVPELFAGCGEDAFSLNVIFDRAIAAGRCFGIVHDGTWQHIGTPEAFHAANKAPGGG